MRLYASVIFQNNVMRLLIFLFFFLSCAGVSVQAQSKAVKSGMRSVVSILTYKDGALKGSGSGFFVGANGDMLASGTLFAGADSAVAIDSDGKVCHVRHIVGVDDMFDCVKVRAVGKKIRPLLPSGAEVKAGDELYMLSYGVKKSGKAEPVKVLSVDSVYSLAYYTLDRPMQESSLSLPLVNAAGELVAVMQPSSLSDTLRSYAVSAGVASSLLPSAKNYGRGYYRGMGIRTALPDEKGDALSCLYIQPMMGDSLSWLNAINDFIEMFPKSHEGYQSLAEYTAVYYRDMATAEKAWNKALSLAGNKAEVHFGKGKVLNSIVQSGDSVSHGMLSLANALAYVDKAIAIEPLPLYISYKADMLYGMQRYSEAAECYGTLAATEMRSPELFSKISQCHVSMKDYVKGVEMLDSAVGCFRQGARDAAPYILTRALVKVSAGKFRDAVVDFNSYEQLAGGLLSAEFYYMREQAELNARMYQQALNDIETAIDLAPGNLLYYIEKGMLCYRVKLTDEGLRTMEKAAGMAPDLADIHYLIGRLHMQKGDRESALASLEKARSLGHPDAEVQINSLGN